MKYVIQSGTQEIVDENEGKTGKVSNYFVSSSHTHLLSRRFLIFVYGAIK
jgi:hypothetical protein